MTHAPYSFLAHLEAVSVIKATPKSMPEATRPKISEPCRPDASTRGLPSQFSKTNVPMSAITKAKNQLLFLISYCGAKALPIHPNQSVSYDRHSRPPRGVHRQGRRRVDGSDALRLSTTIFGRKHGRVSGKPGRIYLK